MKLDLKKAERKTMFGGTRYILDARILLTDEEAALAKKHSLSRFAIVDTGFDFIGSDELKIKLHDKHAWALGSYTGNGLQLEFLTLGQIGNFENAVVSGCKRAKEYMDKLKRAADSLGSSRTEEF